METNRKLTYGTKGYSITIPRDAYNACVLTRALQAPSGVKRDWRTILPEGRRLGHACHVEYSNLTDFLAGTLHDEEWRTGCKTFADGTPRGILSAEYILKGEEIRPRPSLAHNLSIKKIISAGWTKEHRAMSFVEQVRHIAANRLLIADQPVDEVMQTMDRDILVSTGDVFFVAFCVGYELNLSLWAHRHGFPVDELGLSYGQAYVVMLDLHGRVINIQKFTPDATLPSAP